jgi:hypothetical protein
LELGVVVDLATEVDDDVLTGMVLFEKTSHVCTHARDDLGASTTTRVGERERESFEEE